MTLRVVRGGSWSSVAGFVRAAFRGAAHSEVRLDNLGFRILKEDR